MIFRHFLLQVEMAIGEVNAHIFGCSATKEAMLIDAGKFDPAFEQFVKHHGLALKTIFITHDHGDHVAGLAECAEHFGAKVVGGAKRIEGVNVDRVVGHGDELSIGNLTGKVVSTPGHTPIGLSLIFPGMVFTGDALFAGSVGGTSAQDAYDMQIKAIREHILSLPDDYQVHSGHGPATRVGIEKRFNPFFN